MTPPSRTALITAFATIYLVWGSTYLGIRVAVETLPPFLMAGARFLAAGAVLAGWLAATRGFHATARQWRDNAVIGSFLLLGGNGLVAWAEQFIPSGLTALMIGATPLMMVLTEWAWPGGHRPTAITGIGLLLGIAGVAWLAAPWESPAGGGQNLGGVAAILAACVFWALGSIYGRRIRQPAEPLTASALQMLGGGAALMLAASAHGDLAGFSLAAVSARSWRAFAYLILVGSLVGYSTFVWLMKHSTPARVSTYAYVNPVVAVFLGWLILGEPVSARTLAAAAVIVISVAIITTQRSRSTAAAPGEPGRPRPAAKLLPLKIGRSSLKAGGSSE
ncbi:MAG TPA: EamA family transporter [Opitutaceae bacterium]|nr:EamA family transporter [Opitutaceae bacterium]